jgi:SpoIIAA-like
MFEKLAGSSGNVVGYKTIGKISASDYKDLEPTVKALVKKEGNIRMLFDMTEFK